MFRALFHRARLGCVALLGLCSATTTVDAALPHVDVSFGAAHARAEDHVLTISTGAAERTWQLTPSGLRTIRFGNPGAEQRQNAPERGAEGRADWSYPDLIPEGAPAEFVALSATVADDEGFTSKHIRVIAEFAYPRQHVALRCEIWAFPAAPGLRTQLWLKRLDSDTPVSSAESPRARIAADRGRIDWLPTSGTFTAIGYYNDTQHRHRADTPLLREEIVPPGMVDWASIVCAESPAGGVAVVKESHKCVNQPGVSTGSFHLGNDGIAVTGWGIPASALRSDRWQWAWATWSVFYSPGRREMAIKQFDRARYPVRADLDLYVKANTWGSGATGAASIARASESEVRAEIDSIADLGLDTLQIDDGWQSGRMTLKPRAEQEWVVRPDWYPHGWQGVAAYAAEHGVSLGIWHAARAPLEALRNNYETGRFRTWKLDFASINQYETAAAYLAKAREFIAGTGHQVRVNWDVTENASRFGYWWARECGNIWLANRKPEKPDNVVARPWLMLRDVWELARYANLNKFELPIVNFAQVNPALSDAPQHSTRYAVALGLPGIPVFFQTTRLLSGAQREEIRGLLRAYKTVRAELFAMFVNPIGDRPSNASWSGFEWSRREGGGTRYVLLFRERLNTAPQFSAALGLPANQRVRIDDLWNGTSRSADVNAAGAVSFALAPGDVLFARIRTDPGEAR